MFMSTTYDRSRIGNEWTCDKKLSEVDVRSNKWHETYQNVHFLSFRQLVGLAVGRWFIFFCPRSTSRLTKKIFFAQRLKKNFFTSILMGRSGNRKQDCLFLGHRIALPCCGYSLESHWGCVFNEYPQSVLWRNKQNYHQRPALPVPLPVCPAKTQISLGIHPVWSESSLSAHWAVKVSRFLHADSEDSDQKGRMPSLIWVFTGLIGHSVGFIMLQLFLIFWNSLTVFEKETRFLPMTDPTLFDRVG